MMYSRHDYQFCKQIIEKQLGETYDHEYLYYLKVSSEYDSIKRI